MTKALLCVNHTKKCVGHIFSDFIDRKFESMFEMADKGVGHIWVQDGDPSQNCRKANEAMSPVCC